VRKQQGLSSHVPRYTLVYYFGNFRLGFVQLRLCLTYQLHLRFSHMAHQCVQDFMYPFTVFSGSCMIDWSSRSSLVPTVTSTSVTILSFTTIRVTILNHIGVAVLMVPRTARHPASNASIIRHPAPFTS
jgi:hypothetical protein